MVIREYRNSDLSRIQEIYNKSRPDEFYREMEKFESTPWENDDYISSIIDDSHIYVYEEELILGFCGYHDGHIKWLFVSPSSRGLGIASKLLEFVILKLNYKATLTVLTSNERAKNLYFKHGFKVLKEFTVTFQNKRITVNRMIFSG